MCSSDLANWERIKKEEKREKNRDTGVFASLPGSLPPLLRAYRIHSKAARAGFTWATDADQERKLAEEWEEWQAALAGGDAAAQEEEFGDYLFSLVEYGRRRGIKANAALALANAKFLGLGRPVSDDMPGNRGAEDENEQSRAVFAVSGFGNAGYRLERIGDR